MNSVIRPIRDEDLFVTAKRCSGYYKCPQDPTTGKPLAPLVAYAGRYGEQDLQYVGYEYFNFAKMERHGAILHSVAKQTLAKVQGRLPDSFCETYTGFCGAPDGGKALAAVMSILAYTQCISPDKKTVELATATSREKTKMVFGRQEPPAKGDKLWIVEDVCNNFSTTKDLIKLIEGYGATVHGIVCVLNRSVTVEDIYTCRPGLQLPVVSLVRKPIPEYKQDDPEVAEDVQNGNVAWKARERWDELMTAMG